MAASTRAAKKRAATTFHDHLKELRNRAFVVVAFFLVTSSLAYSYKGPLLAILMKPLAGEKLIYLTPGGGFAFIFQVSLYVGIIATIPVLIYSIFRFLSPVLSHKVRTVSLAVILASMVLLIGGVSFGYFFAIPAAMDFLIHFADGFAQASLTAESYLGFMMAYTAGLGILFQLPLILLFIHWIHPLKPKKLFSFERYVVLFAFIAAAIISPTPDAINQTILAVPIIIMYQLGVFAIMASIHRQKRREKLALKREARQQRRQAKQGAPALAVAKSSTPSQPVAKPVVATPSRSPQTHSAQQQKKVASSQPQQVTVAKPRSMDGMRPVVTKTIRTSSPPLNRAPSRATQSSMRTALRPQQNRQSMDGIIMSQKELDDARI